MNTTRILVAEDENAVAGAVAEWLRGLGYEVVAIVSTGEEAVGQAGACRPDVVLMDIRLQGEMDGIAAAAAIRALHDIPVIYLTGHADDATLFRARETAPFGYLLKPFEIRELRAAIETARYKHAAEIAVRRANADLGRRVAERTAELAAARSEVERRLESEKIVATLSANLLRTSPDQVEAEIARSLQTLGEFTGVDLAYAFTFSDHGTVEQESYWAAPEAESAPAEMQNTPLSSFPWTVAQLGRGECIHLPRTADAPPEAAPEKAVWLRQGVQSVVVVPQVRAGRLVGALGLGSVREARAWSEEDVRVLRLAADLVTSAAQNARLFAAVARGKREWETTFDAIADGISLHNRDFRIIRANRTLAGWLGTTVQELVGRPCYEVLHRENEPPAFCLHRQALESAQPMHGEWHDDTSGRTYLTSFYPLPGDAGPAGVVHILRDITEQKGAEESLLQRSRDLALLNEIAAASSETLDFERRLEAILCKVTEGMGLDGGWIRLFGADPAAPSLAAHRGIPAEVLAAPDTLEPSAGLSGEVARTGKPAVVDGGRYRQLAPPGAVQPEPSAMLAAVPIEFQDRVIGALGIFRRASPPLEDGEVQLLATIGRTIGVAIENARLYTAEREQHRRAEESRAQLVESAKLAAAGRLAASLAHEINNPLQSLHNSLQLLLNFSLEPGAQREYLEIAAEEIERLMGLTARILDFARRPPAEMRPTHLPEVVDQVLALAAKYLQHAQVAVERNLPDDLPPVRGNAQELAQVVLNLVLNAVEAMPDGGRLHVAGRHTADGRVALALADTGRGIPPAQQERIFEPFFSTREDGTGLGLSVVYSIVERHGGEITVESRIGEGSTFTVWLPALSEEPDHVP